MVETTTQTFASDVIEPSRSQVVLVDFWAPWCGPCEQLAPVIEKVVAAFGDAAKLVKMNIDDHPEVAGQLGIRSIPAVIAFRQGQPLDGFVGVQSESAIKAFLERVAGPAPDSGADLVAEADAARAAGDLDQAQALYAAAFQQDQENLAALAGLGLAQLEAGHVDAVKQLMTQLPPELLEDPRLQSLVSALRLADQAASLGGAAALQAALSQNPADDQIEFDLAVALAGEGDKDNAVVHLLNIIKRSPEWNDGAAKTELLGFFEAWGPKDPATLKGRRRMASQLFS